MKNPSFLSIVAWIFRGKSVTRAMMNAWLAARPGTIAGTVCDLGGAGRASFTRVVRLPDGYFTIDAMAEARPDIVANIEQDLPIADGVADTVLLLNTLEHVYGFQHVANEMARITRRGGRALIYVPFMVGVHTHRGASFHIDDFFRYTRSSLDRLLREAGFSAITITPLGGLGWVIADLAMVAARFRIVGVPLALICGGLERLTARFRNFDSAERYPLGYMVEATR